MATAVKRNWLTRERTKSALHLRNCSTSLVRSVCGPTSGKLVLTRPHPPPSISDAIGRKQGLTPILFCARKAATPSDIERRHGVLRMRNTQLRDALTGVVPDGKETASARAEKLRPFHKVPRERDIDTSLMWVIEPSMPIKCTLEARLSWSSCATAPVSPSKIRPQLGGS